MDLPNARSSHVAFTCVDPGMATFDLLSLARKLVAAHDVKKITDLAVSVHGFDELVTERLAEAVISAAYAAATEMPAFKSDKKQLVNLKRVQLYGIKTGHAFIRARAEAEGNAVARYLSMLPANMLTPAIYLRQVRELAAEYGWRLRFLGINELKRKKAGAFLAVCQGSPDADAGIVHLEYRPKAGRTSGGISLAGKGICYDTGGISLKTPKHMYGMHEDMMGSAVALGTLIALTRLKLDSPVDCWLALAVNHIGSRAYKPNDVITAIDGTTIEIINTDAEGRMVLADTLVLASQKKPKLLIDYATLTGACVYSLGTAYSGVFTNRKEYNTALIEAGMRSGERVWPFPMDDDYAKPLESRIADIKQCAVESTADHILAAKFLQRFVKQDTPWLHVDLAASNNKGGLAHVPTDSTGFGIRFSLNLLLDQKLL
jgi:leucyl aminopeptidase